MGEKRNTYRILVGKHDRNQLEFLGVDGRKKLKCSLVV
jgi:hypothetical protein